MRCCLAACQCREGSGSHRSGVPSGQDAHHPGQGCCMHTVHVSGLCAHTPLLCTGHPTAAGFRLDQGHVGPGSLPQAHAAESFTESQHSRRAPVCGRAEPRTAEPISTKGRQGSLERHAGKPQQPTVTVGLAPCQWGWCTGACGIAAAPVHSRVSGATSCGCEAVSVCARAAPGNGKRPVSRHCKQTRSSCLATPTSGVAVSSETVLPLGRGPHTGTDLLTPQSSTHTSLCQPAAGRRPAPPAGLRLPDIPPPRQHELSTYRWPWPRRQTWEERARGGKAMELVGPRGAAATHRGR